MTKKFKRTGAGNEILEGGDFYVSYRAVPGNNAISQLTDLMHSMAGLETYNGAETALCNPTLGMINPYFILSGDFRQEYEAIIDQGWEACYAFWLSQWEDHSNPYSAKPLETQA